VIPARFSQATLVSLVVAAVVFWIAYDGGSYGLSSRNTLAIALWWAVIVGVGANVLPAARITRTAMTIGALLAALSLWTLMSILWAPSAENAFNEFNRVTMFLGIYALVVLAATRGTIGRWCDGLALGIVGIAIVALISRFFLATSLDQNIKIFLPGLSSRLSFPLGYWNGLGAFVALGVPLLLRSAVAGRSAITRGLALAPLPAIAAVIYLTSSRGAVATVLIAVFVFFALTERRWSTGIALVVAGLGSAAAVSILTARSNLVNGPFGTDLVERQGRSAALLIALVCIVSALVYGLGSWQLRDRIRPKPWLGRILVAGMVVALVGAVALSHPIRRFENFKNPASSVRSTTSKGYTAAHLLSGSGGGRWQYWSAAVDEWRHYPLLGEGAGSYEQWWKQHRNLTVSVVNTHSLYLQTLGELGPVGFLIVVAFVLVGIGAGVIRARRSVGSERVMAAALTGVISAYAFETGFDWMWELTAVSVIAFIALGLVGYSPVETEQRARTASSSRDVRRSFLRRFAPSVVTVAVAAVLIWAQAIPYLTQLKIGDSQAAVVRGDGDAAIRAAQDARSLEPWASTPYFQLALVSEQLGELKQARVWIGKAINRDTKNWNLWLVAARLDAKLGHVAAAERSLSRAIALNPLSPYLRELNASTHR
jgi:hypothetical protein